MKFHLRSSSKKGKYYSFMYYDQEIRKQVRITNDHIRKRFGKDIIDENQAHEVLKILEAEIEAVKKTKLIKLDWQNEFYQFEKLLESYEIYQKKKAPNSWKSNVHFLKHYVLDFFLGVKKCSSIIQWFDYYQEFISWLENKAYLVSKPGTLISYASKNHVIKSLNTFMKHLFKQNLIDKFFSCESFPSKFLNEKGSDEVITLEEMEKVYSYLQNQGHNREAIFFRFLFFTGMRFNEGLGIHPENIYHDVISSTMLENILAQHNITYHGYVAFNSQPSHETRGLRDIYGNVNRKPLKGRHKIDDKNTRTVVIVDKPLWDSIVYLHNQKVEEYESALHGPEIENYPIFEGIDKSNSTIKLKRAFTALNLTPRTWHSCRHTRATMLIGETGNQTLAKLWLGHTSDKILARYVHTYEMIVRKIKKYEGSATRQIKKIES